MKIYIALIEDRHTDVEAVPFRDKRAAIRHARGRAHVLGDPEHTEEVEIEGWLFYMRYTCEGDFVRVIEAELQ